MFGDDATGVTQIRVWFNRFKNGRTSGATGEKQNQGDAVFFDIRAIVHRDNAPKGQTVTKEYYQEVLRRIHRAVRCKRADLWTAEKWQLHDDSAPAHSLLLIQTSLPKHGIPVIHQPLYSPALVPCNFWLFPKLKAKLKGSRFESREEIGNSN